jgi:hypothetical protein
MIKMKKRKRESHILLRNNTITLTKQQQLLRLQLTT